MQSFWAPRLRLSLCRHPDIRQHPVEKVRCPLPQNCIVYMLEDPAAKSNNCKARTGRCVITATSSFCTCSLSSSIASSSMSCPASFPCIRISRDANAVQNFCVMKFVQRSLRLQGRPAPMTCKALRKTEQAPGVGEACLSSKAGSRRRRHISRFRMRCRSLGSDLLQPCVSRRRIDFVGHNCHHELPSI